MWVHVDKIRLNDKLFIGTRVLCGPEDRLPKLGGVSELRGYTAAQLVSITRLGLSDIIYFVYLIKPIKTIGGTFFFPKLSIG